MKRTVALLLAVALWVVCYVAIQQRRSLTDLTLEADDKKAVLRGSQASHRNTTTNESLVTVEHDDEPKDVPSGHLRANGTDTLPPPSIGDREEAHSTAFRTEILREMNLSAWPIEEIADDKNRLVVAMTNDLYKDFADNFANSLFRLNVTNVILVCLDMASYKALNAIYPQHAMYLPNMQTEGAHRFDSPGFWRLTALRPTVLRAFLELGYSVYYNDIDMAWQHNAWDFIEPPTTELIWHDGQHQLCSCMMYLTPRALPLIGLWEDEIWTYKHKNDQPAFNAAVASYTENDEAKLRINEDLVAFPHGRRFFDQEVRAHLRDQAVVVHNNWISGKEKKRERFEKHGLWRPSGKLHESAAAS